MVGKGLDSYLDQLTEESGSTSLPDILTSLLNLCMFDLLQFGMVGKGLDSYLDQLTEESGSTSLPDILTSLL